MNHSIKKNKIIEIYQRLRYSSCIKVAVLNEIKPNDKKNKTDSIFKMFLSLLIYLDWEGPERHTIDVFRGVQGEYWDMTDLEKQMSLLGFETKKVHTEIDKIDSRIFPVVSLDTNTGDVVMILGVYENKVEIFNYNDFTTETVDISQIKQKYFYLFKRISIGDVDSYEVSINVSPKVKDWFLVLMSRFVPSIRKIFFVSLLVNIFSIVGTLFVMQVYDKVVGHHSVETLFYLLFGIIFVIASDSYFRIQRSKMITWFGCRLDYVVSYFLFERMAYLSVAQNDKNNIANQILRMKSFGNIRDFFASPAGTALVDLPFVLLFILVIFLLGGIIAIVPLCLILIYIFMFFILSSKIDRYNSLISKTSMRKQNTMLETMVKLDDIKINSLQNLWWKRLVMVIADNSYFSFKNSMFTSLVQQISYAISIMGSFFVLVIGINGIWNGSMTIGALIATVMLMWRVISPAQSILTTFTRLRNFKQSIIQCHKLLLMKPERYGLFNARKLPDIRGNVEFKAVTLRYSSDREPVLSGASFDIKKNELIAFFGYAGSGKTSALKLINNIYSSQSGMVLVDGKNVKQFDSVEIRRYIAFLPQNVKCINGTIHDNVRLANTILTDDEINDFLHLILLHEDMTDLGLDLNYKLDDSYSFVLTEEIIFKIGFARAILKQSSILLLDSVPSTLLNSKFGDIYLQLIQELKGTRTIVFVSQRDEMLHMADKIVLFAGEGKVEFDEKEKIMNMIQSIKNSV